jgi:hypothetical protein
MSAVHRHVWRLVWATGQMKCDTCDQIEED